MRPIPLEAAELIKKFEGFRDVGYLCPANVPTAGWGHTGNDVQVGKRYSRARCEEWLHSDIAIAHNKLVAAIGAAAVDALNDNQYSALISFVFNLGARKDWTIWQRVKSGNYDTVPSQLMRFVNAGGKRLPGLVRRRTAEAALWNEVDEEDVEVPSSVVLRRPDMTPPTPTPASAKPMITALVGSAAAVPVAAKQVQDAIAPYADTSPWVGQAVAIIASVAAAAAVVVLFLTWLQHRNAKK